MITATLTSRACSGLPASAASSIWNVAGGASFSTWLDGRSLHSRVYNGSDCRRLKRPWTRSFHATTSRESSKPRLSYRIAASSSAKGRRFNPDKHAYNFDPELQDALGLITGTDPIAGKKQRPESGEDAFFVSKVGRSKSGTVAFGVADGVGGWSESRVDPADFSHGLCSYMAQTALEWGTEAGKLHAKNLLQKGYDLLVEDPSIQAGGSTASVGVAQTDGRVELANLGDSGSVLLRLAAVHHYSKPQTHAFNTPYQLSIIPPRMRMQASIFGGNYLEDLPRDASVTNINMQHGDVLLLATDGVFDNLSNQDLLKIVTTRMILTGAWTGAANAGIAISEHLDALTRPGGLALPSSVESSEKDGQKVSRNSGHTLQSLLALSIAGEAKVASLDYRRDGPFAKEAQRYAPADWYRGGKVDDICALVVVAVEEGR
ncbi:Protein phosphatase 2C 7 [Paecilomyces lecythidis]|uniref:Protein phosphatase n=1 Tax=Paecilomyces lecythidis TaxID=3004212 RepID=A0ABR3XFB1_9EURO